jgi:hypothetical protein
MGVITIEIPQKVKKSYKIESADSAKSIIDQLDRDAQKKKYVDLSDVVGIWADRPESAEEIARELRRKSNSRQKNG